MRLPAAGLRAVIGLCDGYSAKPVQYVKICSLYGAGFFYIPGTDTCLKIGGYVRAEYNINALGSFTPIKISSFNRSTADNNIRTRGVFTLDARTQTEYGTLRSYIQGGASSTTAGNTTNFQTLYYQRAFIQLGGWTFGKATSFFDGPFQLFMISNQTNLLGGDSGGAGKAIAGYTAQFGNGFSANIALEDPTFANFGIVGGVYEAGAGIPDVVGNLSVDQAWGSAQVMGAAHEIREVGIAGGAHASDKWGWAFGGGGKVNLPMLGKGDFIGVQAAYAEGATAYVGSGLAGGFLISRGASTGGGVTSDSTIVAGSHSLTKSWSVDGGYLHRWTPHWKTTAYGAYGRVNPVTVIPGLDPSWDYTQVGSMTVWTPVANLDLSVDVMYQKLRTAAAGTFGAIPVGNTVGDQSIWSAIFRAQRNFWP